MIQIGNCGLAKQVKVETICGRCQLSGPPHSHAPASAPLPLVAGVFAAGDGDGLGLKTVTPAD
jgi:hypothetical protein